MGEVAEMFDVKASLLRYWVAQFDVLQPKRNKKGNRLFTVQDVEHLKVIYHLVKERGMTLDGAKRAMKRRGAAGDEVRRDAELMTRLRHIRALLEEVREDLKAGGEGIVADDELAEERSEEPRAPRRREKPVVKFGTETSGAETSKPAAPKPAGRRVRRKSEEGDNKELFAFYEQSLF